MSTKRSVVLLVCMLVVAFGLGACSHVRNDADVTADVKVRIHEDAALRSGPIIVQSNSGVVVLSGNVETDAERSLAENIAKQVEGVKSVINNLQVISAAVPPLGQPKRAAQPGGGKQAPQRKPSVVKTTKPIQTAAPEEAASSASPPTQTATAQPPQPAADPTQPVAETTQTSVQPAQPAQVTVAEGTRLTVRLIDPVDSEKNKQGDTFRASLDSPVLIQEKTVIPKNADVEARLVSAKSAGHFAGSSAVVLVLTKITVGGKAYDVQTGEFSKKGASRGKRSAAIIGGGTAAGAAIGAIAGGGKGAAIGAAAGAGAGAGVQALTKGEQIKLPSETLLEFQLKAPLTVTPVSGTEKGETAG